MLLMIDNYDSFTYNLVQYLGELGEETHVYRNNKITPEEIRALRPAGIVISPGPGSPERAGISVEVVRELGGSIPILGVCLGHQAIGYAFGGKISRAAQIMHGKISSIHHDGKTIYRELSNPFSATRYHSLLVERENLPDCFEISAWTENGEIMGLRHRTLLIEGIQFHPESILTQGGRDLLRNFLLRCKIF